jgi:hypothetical protein
MGKIITTHGLAMGSFIVCKVGVLVATFALTMMHAL